MGRIIRPADERKLKNKNRTHSQVSGGDAQDVAGLRGTSTWAVEKRAKIQTTSTSGNPRKTILLLDKDDAITDDREQWLGEVEGFDWSGDDLTLATDHYVKQLNHRLPDYDDEEFWAIMDEDQLRSLKIQLALYRIAAHEGEQLKSLDKADLLAVYPPSTLEDQGYFKWCERNFDWYFDPEFCEHAGFKDYQRLVLRNNGEYEQWEYYRKTCNSLQGDQEYIQFWEKLSSETKWIENARYASSHVWDKLERLAFYQAMKIAAEFNNIFTALIYSGFTEYMWTIQFVNPRYEDLTCLYLEIWKRVAKQKMNLKEALKEVFESGVPSSCNVEMQVELKNQHLVTHGPVTHNYETYLAAIEENVSEEKARMLIRESVEIFVSRHRTYYDYAKRKLDIARKIGLIIPSSLHEEPFMTDSQDATAHWQIKGPASLGGRPVSLANVCVQDSYSAGQRNTELPGHCTSWVGIGTRKHIIL